ncbi:MAG TPA: rod shape-determining protein MreC [Polyangia bacterium]|jgi:rod shape-determining protein MreC
MRRSSSLSTWGQPKLPRHRLRDALLVLALIAIPALFLRANLKNPANLNAVDRTVLRVSSPLQAGLAAIMRGVVGVWDGYVNLVNAKRDNARLLAENARLREDAAQARRAAGAAGRYEALLGLRDERSARRLAARVISADASPHFRIVRVKLPANTGKDVRKDMPVLALEGLVGRVRRVYGDYADVQLAVDPTSTFDAVVPRTGTHCLIDGIPGQNRYRCRLEAGVAADDVKTGDVLVTSQLNAAMPRDVSVGVIGRIEQSHGTVHRDAEVAPAVDFARLTEVLVVLEVLPPPPPESQPARRRRNSGLVP